MDAATNPSPSDPRLTVFYCQRCCGPQPAGACGGAHSRFVEGCAADVDATRLEGAYADGADGVMVIGCLGSACRKREREVDAFLRIHAGTVVLRRLGLHPVRLRRHWLSPREAATVPALVTAFRRRLVTLNARREARGAQAMPAAPLKVQAAQA